MRHVRWRRQYLTGRQAQDDANRALVDLLNALADEANSVEHCQDLNELYAMLADAVQTRLEHDPSDHRALEEALATILDGRLPLPAKGTPACTDCGMCDRFKQRIGQWLAEQGG